METESEVTERRRRAVAYHEAGHAVTGYYFGRSLGPMRLYEDTGRLRGEAKVYPGDRGEAHILAAGRVAAEAFDLPQSPEDYAIDEEKLVLELAKEVSADANDDVLESLIERIRAESADLFQRAEVRAAATDLAERLLRTSSIDSGDEVAATISWHLTSRTSP